VELSRRSFLVAAGSFSLLAFADRRALARLAAPAAGEDGRYLTAHELDTLRALTARLLPGPPEDLDPGALEAGAAEAIDLLLGAFTVDPPLIHAGGPFSDRAGAAHDDFADFVPLDAHAELGWRIRLEGSGGDPAREFAGPVRGLQSIYRDGLAHLDTRAQALAQPGFAAAPIPVQDVMLLDQSDGTTQELVGVALANTLEAVYGPPEYGGNRGLVGWTPIGWPGDVQPAGYADAQVTDPDPGAAVSPLDAAGATAALAKFLPGMVGQPRTVGTWWASGRGRAP
jgi:hypothetical protein